MERKLFVTLVILVGMITIGLNIANAASLKDIPRMTVEELKKLFDEYKDDPDPGLVIIDVRTGSSWSESEFMIKTAVREDPKNFASWGEKHPKEKTLVLYCT